MKKKLLLLAVALLFTACDAKPSASNSTSQGGGETSISTSISTIDDGHIEGSKGLQYTLSDDETYYSLTGIGTCKDDEVIVGNWYNGKPVTTIAGAALSTDEGTWGPKRIIVSNGITTIEFRGLRCMTAEYIYLPDTVTSLSKATFIRDSKLKTVVLSGSLTEILDDAFMECTSLQDIYFRGAESDWAKVQISTVNNDLSKVTMHYNYIG